MSDDHNAIERIRVIPRSTVLQMLGLSSMTWNRMEARGETPPKVQLSLRRVGYRVSDLSAWLDARRASHALPRD